MHLEQTYNKIDTKFYDETEYNKAIALKYAFLALIAAIWLVSLVFVIIGKGNVAMETMIVFQLAYVSLLSQEKLEIMLGGLSHYGKYTAGFNIDIVSNQAKCINFAAINMSCSLVNNLNITFVVMFGIVIIFGVLKLINRVLNYRAEKVFIKNKQRKYMIENN